MQPKAIFPNRPIGALLVKAKITLGMTHREFGEALGASERTSLRWSRGSSDPTVPQLCEVAKLVHPRNPAIAAAIAEACSETLESLGIVARAPSTPATTLAPALLADLLLSPGAEVIGAAPSLARAAMLAMFARARELGVAASDIERVLASAATRVP